MPAPPLRLALVGAGFWSRFQAAAWGEVGGHELVAVCDPDRARAEALAAAHGVPAAYDDLGELLARERPDAVDLVTPDTTHAALAALALEHGAAVISQKPLAPTVAEAEGMVATADAAGLPLLVHENFRWQTPVRAIAAALAAGTIGTPFRARLTFSCSFPVYENQPALARAERFILLDLGVHLLDVARFLLGEVRGLVCHTRSVDPRVRGEDVATVLLDQGAATTTVELSYASRLADERFPETFVVIEGDRGSLELGPGHVLRTTTAAGTTSAVHAPPHFAWADPAYDLVHASIVACHRDLLAGLRGEGHAETDAHDNLRTLRLVEAAYASAAGGEVVRP